MRLVGIVLLAVVLMLCTAEGIVILRLRHDVATLAAQVARGEGGARPRDERYARPEDDEGSPPPAAPARAPLGDLPRAGVLPARAAVAPLGAPGGTSPSPASTTPALPAAIDNPEAREQMRAFVAAEMARARATEREGFMQAREQAEADFRNKAAKDLGLEGADALKFDSILADAQTQRRQLFESVRAGDKDPSAIGQEMAGIREKTEQALTSLLGDDKMKQYESMRQRQRGQRGGPGGGRPF